MKSLVAKIKREIANKNDGFLGVWYLAQVLYCGLPFDKPHKPWEPLWFSEQVWDSDLETYDTVSGQVDPDDTSLLKAYWYLVGEEALLDESSRALCLQIIKDGEIDGIEFPSCPSLDEFGNLENMPTYVGSRYSKA